MKIVIEIEMPDRNRDGKPTSKRWVESYMEKNHFAWDNATATIDGTVVWEWVKGRATQRQIEDMKRAIVEVAVEKELGPVSGSPAHLHHGRAPDALDRFRQRLGKEFQQIYDEYEANPDVEWAKKYRKSVMAQRRRYEKTRVDYKAQQEVSERQRAERIELTKQIARDEDIRQQAIEAQGGTRVTRKRLLLMAQARLTGQVKEDPTPTTPEEEKVWERICRSAEAMSTFPLPNSCFVHEDGDRFGKGRTVTIRF